MKKRKCTMQWFFLTDNFTIPGKVQQIQSSVMSDKKLRTCVNLFEFIFNVFFLFQFMFLQRCRSVKIPFLSLNNIGDGTFCLLISVIVVVMQRLAWSNYHMGVRHSFFYLEGRNFVWGINQANVRSCTVHVDSIKSFIYPTNAHKLL